MTTRAAPRRPSRPWMASKLESRDLRCNWRSLRTVTNHTRHDITRTFQQGFVKWNLTLKTPLILRRKKFPRVMIICYLISPPKLDNYDNSCLNNSLCYRLTFSHSFWSKNFLIKYAKQTKWYFIHNIIICTEICKSANPTTS